MHADYPTQGFAVVPLFAPDEIAGLRADVTEHIDRVARALHLPFSDSAPDAGFADRLETVARADPSLANLLRVALTTDAHRGPRFARLLADGRLQRVASLLAGVPVGEPVFRLRANIPSLEHHRHGWHSDVSQFGVQAGSRFRIAAWLPLMDAGPDSGGLEIVPGMRDAPIPHDEAQDYWIADAALEGLPRVAPDCAMGSAIFVDRYTPHRALPSSSDSARIALVIWFKASS